MVNARGLARRAPTAPKLMGKSGALEAIVLWWGTARGKALWRVSAPRACFFFMHASTAMGLTIADQSHRAYGVRACAHVMSERECVCVLFHAFMSRFTCNYM